MKSEPLYAVDENQVSHNDFDDEVVVIHFETGNYYSLRETAASIWKCLAHGPASASSLLDIFRGAPSDATEQVGGFLADLQSRGLLVEITSDASAAGTDQSPTLPLADLDFKTLEFEAFEDLQALLVADVIHDTDERGWPHMAPDEAA